MFIKLKEQNRCNNSDDQIPQNGRYKRGTAWHYQITVHLFSRGLKSTQLIASLTTCHKHQDGEKLELEVLKRMEISINLVILTLAVM